MYNNILMFLKVLTLYIGTVIGAGFASGQEVLQFFINYGTKGIWGVVVVTVCFSYLGMIIMYMATKFKSGSYQEILPFLMGPTSRIMDVLSLIMLVGGLGIMLAGSGAVINQYLGLPNYAGILAAAAVTIIVILGGVERVLAANLILVPIKLLVVCVIAIMAIANQTALIPAPVVPVTKPLVASHWLWASILYVSYNMVVPLAALSSVGRIVTPKIGILAGLTGGAVLGLTTGLITMAGLSYYPEITNYPVPMLYLAETIAPVLKTVFALLIWVAILTTAIADAHGFASRIAPGGGKLYKLVGTGICVAVLPLTKLDFAQLVQKLYPMFGYAGLILLAALLVIPVLRFSLKK
ncbi:putative membrane protein YkvI [Desulfohalotomaculum tongense]|uniref:YkvI family membrane protein n=1 Tax=Desulforadius tongensis TaxID=1216062 RepID=UPI0019596D68|nr:hypothetical protein [Desulforadius tongensis]MBM7855805.1 putative membrane protein YkvI [Desulforadius tongensis]